MESSYDYESLSAWFRDRVHRDPDCLAVVGVDGRHHLTYRELDDASREISVMLRDAGITKGDKVIIYLDRCVEFVLSYLAILQADAVYVPLEVSFSEDLVKSLMAHIKPRCIITKKDLVDKCKESIADPRMAIVHLDLHQSETEACKLSSGLLELPQITSNNNQKWSAVGASGHSSTKDKKDFNDLVHVIFTSGTTGIPKGIAGTHRNLLHTFHWWLKLYPYDSSDKEACNIAFIWEFPRPILAGIPMYVIPDSIISDPWKLGTFIRTHGITRLFITSSVLELLLDVLDKDICQYLKSLRMLILCGELVSMILLRRTLTYLPHLRIINLYGISEAADICSINLTDWYHKHLDYQLEYCPVGKPIPGVDVRVLDANMQPVNRNVSGEVYVRGPTIAEGYYGNETATEKAFVKLTSTGERYYKTSDKGMFLPDNNLVILGRAGHVVQIRGHSVDIQIVETQLLKISGIQNAVIKICQDGVTNSIVAYVISHVPSLTEAIIKADLRKVMAEYMIPARVYITKTLPITARSGKVDVSDILPETTDDVTQEKFENNTSIVECEYNGINRDHDGVVKENNSMDPDCDKLTEVLHIWKKILGNDSSPDESFFDAGGHSLSAARFVAMVNKALHKSVQLSDFLRQPTLTNMMYLLRQHGDDRCYGKAEQYFDVDDEIQSLTPTLPSSFQTMLDLFWNHSYFNDYTPSQILLTGATGFLGVHLLHQLLVYSESRVICLIRAESMDKAHQKLVSALNEYQLLDESEITIDKDSHQLKYHDMPRVSVIVGNIAKPQFGMDKPSYQCLTAIADIVIHAAAQVNYLFPYELLKESNCYGTKHVLEFCCSSKMKPLHYISSASVRPKCETDFNDQWTHLKNGYGQSKYIAECLVRRLMSRGLPVVIYRPGNIWGDERTSILNRNDLHTIFMKTCIQLKLVPNAAFSVEATPVNYVTHFIISRLSRISNVSGTVYDLMNRKTFTSCMLLSQLKHVYPEMKLVKTEEWLKSLTFHEIGGSELFNDLLNSGRRMNNTEVQLTPCRPDDFPVITSDILRKYIEHL